MLINHFFHSVWLLYRGLWTEMLHSAKATTPSDRQAYVSKGMWNLDPKENLLYLLLIHPKSYNFYIINDGIDKQTSLLRPLNGNGRRRLSTASVSSAQEGRLRRRSSVSQTQIPATVPQETAGDMDIDELERSMSALQFVPASVMRNRPKAPQKRSWDILRWRSPYEITFRLWICNYKRPS